MTDINPSVWNQNNKGEWKLYFNTDTEIISPIATIEQSKFKHNHLPENNLILGTLVMTPKGMGRYIKNNKGLCTVRFEEESKEEEFEINKLSNTFNCFLTELSNDNINVIRFKLKVIGKVEDILNELEKLKKINKEESDYSLIYLGKVLKNDFTFEQLNILNNCKILLLKQKNIILCVSRFSIINKYWFTYTLDGICFTPSEKIKLIGVGIYGSYENKTVSGILKILDGGSINNKSLIEENVEIPPSKTENEAIIKLYFSKPVICKKNQDYSVILQSRMLTNSYCGQSGKKFVEGENGISFTFKKIQGRNTGTTVEIGNFPELYYYAH